MSMETGSNNDTFESIMQHRRRKERLFLFGTPVVVALALFTTWVGGTHYVAANCVEQEAVRYCPETWRSVRSADGPRMVYVPVEQIAAMKAETN